jgi:putative membrane protein
MNAVMTLAAPRWGHMGDNGWTGGWWLWGSLIMILWLALAVGVTWLVIRSINSRAAAERESTGPELARDILARRYAQGEIDTEEYSERLAMLR